MRAMEKALERMMGTRCRDRGEAAAGTRCSRKVELGWIWEKGSPGLLALFGHTLTLY